MKDLMRLPDLEERFFSAYLSAEARAFLLLMYRVVKGRKEGIYLYNLFKEVFTRTHKKPRNLIRELERHAFVVGRYRGKAYVYQFLEKLPFDYKDVPLPEETKLQDSPRLYGAYTTLLLASMPDRIVPRIPMPSRKWLIANLVKIGYLEWIGLGVARIKFVPEGYERLFLV
ncbi:MAG: hypothetical protein ACPLRS_02160 [Hydrogenobacter sp.]